MPLFLELVRQAAITDAKLAGKALRGLKVYQTAERPPAPRRRQPVARIAGASLRDCGGGGPPVVLVPSIINPPHILDLDPQTSLADALAPAGRIYLVDWGTAVQRSSLSLSGHVTELLLPLLSGLEQPPLLVGYCLGGTMALAAARIHPVAGVATLASPWDFAAYPHDGRAALAQLWQQGLPVAEGLGALPNELLQAAFWSLDPRRTVAKYARLHENSDDSLAVRRFVLLEDWANAGEPLPLPAARELLEDLFDRNLTATGNWLGRGLPGCPVLHFTASNDRIVPARTVAAGKVLPCPAGHVGMVVGRGASAHLHRPLREWLAAHAHGG